MINPYFDDHDFNFSNSFVIISVYWPMSINLLTLQVGLQNQIPNSKYRFNLPTGIIEDAQIIALYATFSIQLKIFKR